MLPLSFLLYYTIAENLVSPNRSFKRKKTPYITFELTVGYWFLTVIEDFSKSEQMNFDLRLFLQESSIILSFLWNKFWCSWNIDRFLNFSIFSTTKYFTNHSVSLRRCSVKRDMKVWAHLQPTNLKFKHHKLNVKMDKSTSWEWPMESHQ